MQLVEKPLSKADNGLDWEADGCSWQPLNFYHGAKYIYSQNFFARQQTNAQALDRAIKTSWD